MQVVTQLLTLSRKILKEEKLITLNIDTFCGLYKILAVIIFVVPLNHVLLDTYSNIFKAFYKNLQIQLKIKDIED